MSRVSEGESGGVGDREPAGSGGDVIEVRADERFDEERVADYLRDRLPGGNLPLRVRQFGGGHANLTYLLEYGGPGEAERFEYVLRRPPLGPVAKGAHDMKREYRALSVLWKEFPYAARAHLFCDDHAVIGADFVVMERLDGVVVRRTVPDVFGGGDDPVANRKLSEVVVDTLAELHGVDPVPLGLDGLGRPEGFLQRQVGGWADRHERAKAQDIPIATELAAWLERERPESPPARLLHNDWKLDNMAVAADDPGRCVAVYDWDMCTVGDPLCDFGTLLCSWVDPGEDAMGVASMPSQTPGFLSRADAVARYCERAAADPAAVPYYHVFGMFKMAVVLEQIHIRYVRGQTKDDRFAALGEGAVRLFEGAAAARP